MLHTVVVLGLGILFELYHRLSNHEQFDIYTNI